MLLTGRAIPIEAEAQGRRNSARSLRVWKGLQSG